MDIRIITPTTALAGTLNDSAAARDLAAALPLTLALSDFHGTEKIADLPGRLTTEGSPSEAAAEAGDLAYYAPWGNPAIFYRGFQRPAGLIILWRINRSLDPLIDANDGLIVTIEAVDPESTTPSNERKHT
ncbi:cyclophilin-like fold protein [Streptomyces acidicola]|uniref:cyclophilin-like fold protein n=1 Tax=Streptomyces acidicola TaxID=2596892 RepID=UPI003802AA9C